MGQASAEHHYCQVKNITELPPWTLLPKALSQMQLNGKAIRLNRRSLVSFRQVMGQRLRPST